MRSRARAPEDGESFIFACVLRYCRSDRWRSRRRDIRMGELPVYVKMMI
jgi:hypothetical protein